MEIKEVFEPIVNFVKNFQKKEKDISKQAAKDRLKLVLMQDRASVSPDFFEMMKKEIIDVIKKYIEIDEESLEVQLTRGYEAGLEGPALYANIPIKNIKPVASNGEDISDDIKDIAEMVEDEIQSEANKIIEDGSTVVKAEIDTVADEETPETVVEEINENAEEVSEEETQKEEEIQKVESAGIIEDVKVEDDKEDIVEEKFDESEPMSADVIAENVAREMKKSVAKSAAVTKAVAGKKTAKKTSSKKTSTKKSVKSDTES